jgi:hypothetical protein
MTKNSTPSISIQYSIQYRPHPSGLKLQVNDALDQPIYHIYRRSTFFPSYVVRDLCNLLSTSLQIKTKDLGVSKQYLLFANHLKQLSIQSSQTSKEIFLQNAQHKIIARFLSLRSNLVVLRAANTEFGRIHIFELPPPRKFKIKAQLHPDQQWLFALLLYAVVKAEDSLVEIVSDDDTNRISASRLAEG